MVEERGPTPRRPSCFAMYLHVLCVPQWLYKQIATAFLSVNAMMQTCGNGLHKVFWLYLGLWMTWAVIRWSTTSPVCNFLKNLFTNRSSLSVRKTLESHTVKCNDPRRKNQHAAQSCFDDSLALVNFVLY